MCVPGSAREIGYRQVTMNIKVILTQQYTLIKQSLNSTMYRKGMQILQKA